MRARVKVARQSKNKCGQMFHLQPVGRRCLPNVKCFYTVFDFGQRKKDTIVRLASRGGRGTS
jgi:hypothetical protein